MAINISTLFTQLGKIFYAQAQINVARGTTIPPLIADILDEFDGGSLDLKRAIANVESSNRSFQSGASGAMSSLQISATNVVVETVNADVSLPNRTLDLSLQELIRQMIDQSDTVDASTAAASVTPDGSNSTDAVLVVSAKREDGLNCEAALAETIVGTASSANTLQLRSPAAIAAKLSESWPAGSGISRTLTATNADAGLIGNGSFDDETGPADAPDDWIVAIGTVGTTLKLTNYEVQELVVTGPPTAGTYTISWTNAAGKVQTTAPLAFDASGSDVQAALQQLTGLENIEVESTGTSPLYTHTITFTGVAGNVAQITVTNNTTGGTYTPGTTSAGSAIAFKGKSLEFDSDGSQLTTIYRRVELQALKQYAFNIWAATDSAPAAGVLTIDLVDGIGGSVIADQASVNNAFTIDCTALTTTWTAKSGVFRTPRVLPAVVYLRIRISTAISNTSSVFLDEATLVEMTRLYPGGPSAALFSGRVDLGTGSGQVQPDRYEIAVTNDRAGAFQEWFERNFAMAQKGLILPSNTGGTETLADSLIG